MRGSAQSVVVFPDGRRSAVASADKTIDVWDFVSGKALQRLRGHTGPVFALALIRNGKMLASAGEDGTCGPSGTRTGGLLCAIEVSDNAVMGLAFSPDDRRILTGDHDSLAKLYDVASGRVLMRYRGHARPVRCVAFVPDASRIVTASEDKSVRLWETQSGRELINYDGVTDTVYGIAVSPNGRRLAAGLADKKILLWDLNANLLLHTFELKTGGCLGLTFTHDGRELIAGLGDGSVWVGSLPAKLLGESDAEPLHPHRSAEAPRAASELRPRHAQSPGQMAASSDNVRRRSPGRNSMLRATSNVSTRNGIWPPLSTAKPIPAAKSSPNTWMNQTGIIVTLFDAWPFRNNRRSIHSDTNRRHPKTSPVASNVPEISARAAGPSARRPRRC